MKRTFFFTIGFISLLIFGCENTVAPKVEEIDRVEEERLLGQLLFHERRLSKDNTVSCAHCHMEGLAFTDGLAKSNGIAGRKAFRNSPTLFNMKDFDLFMFDGVIESLEVQALSPIQDHNEMGSTMAEIIAKLKDDKVFKAQVHKAYGRDLDARAVTQSLAAFQRSLISTNSRFDLYKKDSVQFSLSQDELQGFQLFNEKFRCIQCHALPHFSNGKPESNGIHLTADDWGRYRATGLLEDKGKFKVPSLRNIEITAPYMHDGRFATLEEVLKFYNSKKESHGNQLVMNYNITPKEQQQIIAFLKTLTDTIYLK